MYEPSLPDETADGYHQAASISTLFYSRGGQGRRRVCVCVCPSMQPYAIKREEDFIFSACRFAELKVSGPVVLQYSTAAFIYAQDTLY